MNPDVIFGLLLIAANLGIGFPLHIRAMRKAAATAEVRAEMRTRVYAETAASQRIEIGYLDARVGRLKDDAAWARLQAVLHDERHTCLVSLDGIRATAPDDEMADWEREILADVEREMAASLTPIYAEVASGNVVAFGRRG